MHHQTTKEGLFLLICTYGHTMEVGIKLLTQATLCEWAANTGFPVLTYYGKRSDENFGVPPTKQKHTHSIGHAM